MPRSFICRSVSDQIHTTCCSPFLGSLSSWLVFSLILCLVLSLTFFFTFSLSFWLSLSLTPVFLDSFYPWLFLFFAPSLLDSFAPRLSPELAYRNDLSTALRPIASYGRSIRNDENNSAYRWSQKTSSTNRLQQDTSLSPPWGLDRWPVTLDFRTNWCEPYGR